MQMIEANVKEKMKMLEKIQKFKFVCSSCGKCKDQVKCCPDCKRFFCCKKAYCDRCNWWYCLYCRANYGYGPPDEYPDGHAYCEKCNFDRYGNDVGGYHAYTKQKLEKL